MDRLTNEDLSAEELDKEIKRSDALQKVAKTIIDNGSLALHAKKYLDEYGQGDKVELPLIGVTDKRLMEENETLRETVRNLQERIKQLEDWD